MRFKIFYLFIIIIYCIVAFQSPGYDDDIINVRMIEKFGYGTIHIVQTMDVHPPGSYLADWALYEVIGRWDLIRTLIALLTAFALISGINYVRENHGDFSGTVCFIVLGLNPAYLLWGTGLRWYAYFVPILIAVLQVPTKRDSLYWAKCFLGLTLLGYFGYAMFILAPSIILLYWVLDQSNVKVKLKAASIWAVAFLVLYAYQMQIFLNVHVKNKDTQISSLFKNLVGFLVGNISNQGVFPVSIAGVVTIIGMSGFMGLILYSQLKLRKNNPYLLPFLMSGAAAIFSGIAGKFRNLVVVSPFQGFWMASATELVQQKKLLNSFLLCILVGNIWGVVNVTTHKDTTKNSWNLPVKDILNELASVKSTCNGDYLVLSYDLTISRNVEVNGFNQVGPFDEKSVNNFNKPFKCVTVVQSYVGNKFADEKFKNMMRELGQLKYGNSISKKLSRDDFYQLKRKLDSNYPEYPIQITTYYDVSYLPEFNSWLSEY
ncbi:hypothetical protein AAKU67_000543 [Oxalobacteraceae bacterium GrIS 2.11]